MILNVNGWLRNQYFTNIFTSAKTGQIKDLVYIADMGGNGLAKMESFCFGTIKQEWLLCFEFSNTEIVIYFFLSFWSTSAHRWIKLQFSFIRQRFLALPLGQSGK